MPAVLYRPTYCHKKGDGIRFWLQGYSRQKNKNFHSNLALETGGFSPGVTTSLHNTLSYTPITDQYLSPIIYCLSYTLVSQVLISARDLKTQSLLGRKEYSFLCCQNSLCSRTPLINELKTTSAMQSIILTQLTSS